MNTANSGARVLVRGSGDGAGIEDDNFGVGGHARPLPSFFPKLTLDSGPVGLGCTTAKILDIEAGHASILTQGGGLNSL